MVASPSNAFRSPRRARRRETLSQGRTEESVFAEDAPKQCALCGRPLTVGERMFYFLEGAGASPTCRTCLARQRGDLNPAEGGLLPWDESASSLGGGGDGTAGRSDGLVDRVRSFLQEEFDRIDLALDHLPAKHPDLPMLRSLHDEGQQQLTDGRLHEALDSLADLRRILVAVDRKGTPLTASWDESVEELFDRVVARSRAMARRLVPPSEEILAEVEPPVRESSKTTRASS